MRAAMPGTDASIGFALEMKRRAPYDARLNYHRLREKQSISETVHPAHRYRLQRLAGEAGTRGILAIGGNAVAARAEVVVRAGLIGLAGIDGIPVGLLVEVMLVADGVHVGRVVDRTRSRITRRLPGMRPSEVDVVLTRDFLRHRQPGGVVLPLVEVRIRGFPGQSLEDHVEDRIGRKRVLNTHLRRG